LKSAAAAATILRRTLSETVKASEAAVFRLVLCFAAVTATDAATAAAAHTKAAQGTQHQRNIAASEKDREAKAAWTE
jgi:hypothetical protein